MAQKTTSAQSLKERIILGIDPGTNVLGYGVLKVVGNKAEMVTMGVIDLRKVSDIYLKLGRIYERVMGIIDSYLPDEMAVEAPFFGKNVQSMLKLGRAEGVAIAAAISRQVPICEYAPLKVKMSITGKGSSSKQQVAVFMQKMLNIPESSMLPYLDATDALAVAYCHFLHSNRPDLTGSGSGTKSWKAYAQQHGKSVSDTTTGPQKKLAQLLKTSKKK